jgi:aldehyde:ferredoxin oxidoreductase
LHGFSGRVLHIDLTSGRSAHHELEESRLRKYLGGIGLGTSLLYDYAPEGVDPLSPENPLIFASAPLVGTGLTTTAWQRGRLSGPQEDYVRVGIVSE